MSNVKGLKKLVDTLKKIPRELEDDVAKIVIANGQEIEAKAKIAAPVDTGKLQQSIKSIQIGKLTVNIKANATGLAPYAVYVEYGTRFQRKQPFLFPAYFKQRRQFIEDLEALLEKTFKKV